MCSETEVKQCGAQHLKDGLGSLRQSCYCLSCGGEDVVGPWGSVTLGLSLLGHLVGMVKERCRHKAELERAGAGEARVSQGLGTSPCPGPH